MAARFRQPARTFGAMSANTPAGRPIDRIAVRLATSSRVVFRLTLPGSALICAMTPSCWSWSCCYMYKKPRLGLRPTPTPSPLCRCRADRRPGQRPRPHHPTRPRQQSTPAAAVRAPSATKPGATLAWPPPPTSSSSKPASPNSNTRQQNSAASSPNATTTSPPPEPPTAS